MRHAWLTGSACAALAIASAACGGSSSKTASSVATAAAGGASSAATSVAGGASSAVSSATSGGKKIGLLLPETKTTRYETADRPLFEAKIKELCPDCTVDYQNAAQDASKQQQQAEAALTNGDNVLVLDPVDGKAAAVIVAAAKAKNVPVVSYDRLLLNSEPDVYISFDNEQVGKLQGQAFVDKLKKDGKTGSVVMINGSPTDNNATLFKKGAHSVIDSSGFKVVAEYDTPDWSPDKAQAWMDQQITKLGKTGFVGVYAANDGTVGGAIAAMKQHGIDPKTIVTTGQDAQLDAIQRIITGDQYMTVYKAIKPEADAAAQAAVDLANGKPVANATAKVNNGKLDVPSILLTPVAITRDNVKKIFDDKFLNPSDVCTGAVSALCAAAGVS